MTNELLIEAPPTDATDFDDFFGRVSGALIASAAADAMGWMTEFVRGRDHLRTLYSVDRIEAYRSWKKTSGGRFNAYTDFINKGEYSDDTQLSLAVARSITPDGTQDIDHFSKVELPLWLDYARGAGATVTAAARAIQRKSATWDRNFFRYSARKSQLSYAEAGANGAAMRVGPLALANAFDPEQLFNEVCRNAVVTHGHPRAILGAALYAEAVRQTLTAGRTHAADLEGALTQFVSSLDVPSDARLHAWAVRWSEHTGRAFASDWHRTKEEVLSALEWMPRVKASSDIPRALTELGCFAPETKGSGTATVLAALVISRVLGGDLREAVLAAVNQLTSDTDTIAAFVGALCGARHGYLAVPADWASELQDYEYFMRVALELSRIAVRQGKGGRALLPADTVHRDRLPNLLDLLRDGSLSAKERVYHPLFGYGLIDSVEAQKLRRRDGGEAIFARVVFDLGQSCKFRLMSLPGRSAKQRKTRVDGQPPGRLFE